MFVILDWLVEVSSSLPLVLVVYRCASALQLAATLICPAPQMHNHPRELRGMDKKGIPHGLPTSHCPVVVIRPCVPLDVMTQV